VQIYVAIESRKREVLDKHLDMIVGQTERFSKMLAQVSRCLHWEAGFCCRMTRAGWEHVQVQLVPQVSHC
jgi:hypothetical protein